VAGVTRLRITDRVDGETLADVEAAGLEPGTTVPPPGERPIVLPAARPSATRGRTAVEVVVGGWRFELEVEDADLADLRERATASREAAVHHGPTEVRAIIPGRVVSVAVEAGDTVVAGQRLLAVEAMKMENELRATAPGTVQTIEVAAGTAVEKGALLVSLT
jgi:biotin carboxyl carrier protein